jgi:putative phosphoribosyl transferase
MGSSGEEHLVRIAAGSVLLEGDLSLPQGAQGIVLFAHGSGSSRLSLRNRYVAQLLNQQGSRHCWSTC